MRGRSREVWRFAPLARRHEHLLEEADAACRVATIAWRTRAGNLRAVEERAQRLLAEALEAQKDIEAARLDRGSEP